MIRLDIESYDCNGNHYEHAEKFISDWANLYIELEETLYILYEIEPMNSEWRNKIRMDGTIFSYAKVEACMVNLYKYNNKWYLVEVRDI